MRNKKAFFNEQCLIIEENQMGKTRDLFRRIGKIKGSFHPKMGTIKDKNGKDLVDNEEIKKRWKVYMEEPYRKDLNEPDYHDRVVSHPEPDILECEVKWALKSTPVSKANGCNEIPAELFKSLKDDATKVLQSLCQQIWKTISGHRTGKGQSSSQSSRKVVPKNMLTIGQLHLSPLLVRSYLKFYVLGFSIM